MCRSIKRLLANGTVASEEEVKEAARQFVRKISGFRKPSRKNEVAFERAVEDVAIATRKLLNSGMQKDTRYS